MALNFLNSPSDLAGYACHPEQSKGRDLDQKKSQYRTEFQRDRDRIIHSTAFRRLKEKTQVFIAHEGDHYRTRLTHSLEVAQIARTLARVLRVNEDLTETLALAHDLGHPPFGHSGERALQAVLQNFGGFDHNAQTLRIITHLENRYRDFSGLNLTWETKEGIVKHNGPVLTDKTYEEDLPWAIRDYPHYRDLQLETYAGLEAQIAALSDDIAYNNHDIDDGLRAGLFSLEQIAEAVPFLRETLKEIERSYPNYTKDKTEHDTLIHELIRELIGSMVKDVIHETQKRIEAVNPKTVDEVRQHDQPLVSFSDGYFQKQQALRSFLNQNMYRHYRVNRRMSQATRIVKKLFDLYFSEPNLLPFYISEDPYIKARSICDYIAGMTDRYALEQHSKLF